MCIKATRTVQYRNLIDYEVYTQFLIPKKSMILPQSKIREHTVEYVEADEKSFCSVSWPTVVKR